MKLLGEIVLFTVWGVLSFWVVIPSISTVEATALQIVVAILWIGTFLTTLFIFDASIKQRG